MAIISSPLRHQKDKTPPRLPVWHWKPRYKKQQKACLLSLVTRANHGAIAQQSGISKQNLLYYFSSKRFFRKVLQNIVDLWLERMVFAEQKNATPEQLIEAYIRGKLQLSHDNPDASKVFAQEIIAGVYAA